MMTTDIIFTVKELGELAGISRQAMRQHVDKLDKQYITKNERGYKAVTLDGALLIADKLDNETLSENLSNLEENSHKSFNSGDIELVTELKEQLSVKDKQIEKLQQLLDQQQQLTLHSNQQINSLESTVSQLKIENEEFKSKKWWQFWK